MFKDQDLRTSGIVRLMLQQAPVPWKNLTEAW